MPIASWNKNNTNNSNPATVLVDPLEAVPTPTYPDQVMAIGGHGDQTHAESMLLLKAQSQVDEEASTAETSVAEELTAAAATRDPAIDQHRTRDLKRHAWELAQQRQNRVERALGSLRRHPHGDKFRYYLTWALIVAGDAMGGASLLVNEGDTPWMAALFMTALGLTITTTGLVGRDIRDWKERKAIEDLEPLEDELQAIREDAFRFTKSARETVLKTTVAGMAVVVLIGIAGLLGRLNDGFGLSMAYMLWASAIATGSWFNAWVHGDPAGITIDTHRELTDKAHETYVETDTTAVDAHQAHIANARTIAGHHRAHAAAAFNTMKAQACAHLAENPALDGHSSDATGRILAAEADMVAFDRIDTRVARVAAPLGSTTDDAPPVTDSSDSASMQTRPTAGPTGAQEQPVADDRPLSGEPTLVLPNSYNGATLATLR